MRSQMVADSDTHKGRKEERNKGAEAGTIRHPVSPVGREWRRIQRKMGRWQGDGVN